MVFDKPEFFKVLTSTKCNFESEINSFQNCYFQKLIVNYINYKNPWDFKFKQR